MKFELPIVYPSYGDGRDRLKLWHGLEVPSIFIGFESGNKEKNLFFALLPLKLMPLEIPSIFIGFENGNGKKKNLLSPLENRTLIDWDKLKIHIPW